ncbi:COG1361 family protein [Halorussus amylolyticus]|uniref:hypothetical protein n=1 Tax=Halorussus amylolyticus TaxID=1126242 RepID=UPI00104AF7D4|nr:hypothetical protein [Halorussus amylolyticus]
MTRTTLPALLAALVLVSTVAPATAGVAAADGDFVSVSVDAPAFPTPEQPFQITATVSNAEPSDTTYNVRKIEVREDESENSDLIDSRSTGLRSVDPGETTRRSVDVTLNETGRHDLYVHVLLRSPDGDEQRLVHPVTLRVNGEHPQLELDTEPSVPGESRDMRVNVSNGRSDAIRGLSVELESDDVSFDDSSKVRARLESGSETSFSFTGDATESARHPVKVTLSYTTDDGEPRTMTRTLDADFTVPNQPSDRPQVSVETESAVADAWRSLNVTVSNGMDSAVRQMSLEAASDDVTIRENQRVVPSLEGSSERTFSFRAKATDPGTYPVNLTLVYTGDDGIKRQINQTVRADFTEPDNPGNVSLTGVSIERSGDTVALSGSAVNRGGEEVESVLVSVADAEDVTSAQPQPEYFVGTVESSDFVTFDVNARLSNNRTSVPLEVSYVVDDVTITRTEMVDVGPASDDSEESQSSGGPLPFVALGGLALVALVGGVWWFRR